MTFTDEELAAVFGVTVEEVRADRERQKLKEENRKTHDEYLGSDGLYHCRRCGAVEWETGQAPCKGKPS